MSVSVPALLAYKGLRISLENIATLSFEESCIYKLLCLMWLLFCRRACQKQCC